jgi:hypothetical protein
MSICKGFDDKFKVISTDNMTCDQKNKIAHAFKLIFDVKLNNTLLSADNKNIWVICEIFGACLGLCCLCDFGTELKIEHFGVVSAWRGRNLGKIMGYKILEIAKNRKITGYVKDDDIKIKNLFIRYFHANVLEFHDGYDLLEFVP